METTQAMQGLMNAMHTYFQGEKTEALVFILPIGLLSLVFGLWSWFDTPTGFMRGVAVPFLAMGLVMSTVGGVVGFRTPAQVQGVEQALRENPHAAIQAEIARMDKVNKGWSLYLAVWAAFGVVGLALRFTFGSDLVQGIGIALVFFSGVGLLVDGFAERRTHPYTAALIALSGPQHAIAP